MGYAVTWASQKLGLDQDPLKNWCSNDIWNSREEPTSPDPYYGFIKWNKTSGQCYKAQKCHKAAGQVSPEHWLSLWCPLSENFSGLWISLKLFLVSVNDCFLADPLYKSVCKQASLSHLRLTPGMKRHFLGAPEVLLPEWGMKYPI